MNESDTLETARRLFLDGDNTWGCAEAALLTLKAAYGLPDPTDSAAAMALNGGIAYSGRTCGAITGAAIAVGLLAGRRITDHRAAKQTARRLVARILDDFEAEHGASDCRDLIGMDIRTEEGHRAFIEGGTWRDTCMRQIEFVVGRLAPLADEAAWNRALREVDEVTPPASNNTAPGHTREPLP